MMIKILVGVLVALGASAGGVYLANATSGPDCCYPGSPCCEAQETCCLNRPTAAVKSCCTNPEAGLMPDCCFPGSVCCDDAGTCCLTAMPVVAVTAKKSCCGTGAACCEADAAK